MLWRGRSEAEVAEALGIDVMELRCTMKQDAAWCRAEGRCRWCEILLARVERYDNETCAECAQVLAPGHATDQRALRLVDDGI